MKTKIENRMYVLMNKFVLVIFLLVAVIGKGQEWELKNVKTNNEAEKKKLKDNFNKSIAKLDSTNKIEKEKNEARYNADKKVLEDGLNSRIAELNSINFAITYKKEIKLNAIPKDTSNKNNYFVTIYLDSTVSFKSSDIINYSIKIDSISAKETKDASPDFICFMFGTNKIVLNLKQNNKNQFTTISIGKECSNDTINSGIILADKIPISASDLPYQKLFRNRHHYKFLFNKVKTRYVGINYTPSFGNRSLQINQPQFQEYDALSERNANEYARFFNTSFAVQIGYNYNYSHVVFAQYQHSQKGFHYVDNSKAVDSSGIYNIKKSASSADYRSNGFALGYKYINNHSSLINPIFESALHFNWANQLKNLGRNYFAWSSKLGVGMSINICQFADFNILPNVIYDFNTVKASQLNTRFYNLGIDFGFGFRIGNQKK